MPQYQGVWNLAQQAQALTRQQWVTDPLYDYTTLLLQADNAANGAQNNTFLDSSNNSFAITRNGGNPGMTQGSFSPFSLQPGEWSNFFNGTDAWLITPVSAAFAFGTGDFTLEAWIYTTSSSTQRIFSFGATNTCEFLIINTGSSVYLNFYNGTTNYGSTSYIVPQNQWVHVAATRSSSNLRLFINGVLQNTPTALTNNYSTNTNITVGRYGGSAIEYFSGYMSNARVVKGRAVYTSNFTPSTSPLGATSGGQTPPTGTETSLLTCQSNRFIDNSTANSGSGFALTINGTPSVQAFSPFAPQYQYTPTVTGGSGYFDGTGDWLSVARNTAFIPTTGDFTVEMWIYPNSLQLATLIGLIEAGLDADWSFESLANGKVSFFVGSTTLSTDSTATYIPRQWNHIMACRSGGTLYVGVNGAANSATSAGSLNNSKTYPLTIGADQNGDERLYSGYISGVRFINGTALYASTTYTIPAAPLTAVTNTSLLCNFTNAGILDGTMKNNLETVGNAQVSTSVVKYGSGSMYFDGTGDYLRAPNSQNIAFGTGDFTIEMWLWFNATPTGDVVVIDARPSNTAVPWIITADATSGGTLYFYDGTTYRSTIPITPQAWMHFAVSRVNGTLRIFNNGVQGFSGTVTTSLNPTGSLVIGARNDGLVPFTGYMDDLRITKGIARYTRNFTPPQVALPRQ
jgi:hypothetical protein